MDFIGMARSSTKTKLVQANSGSQQTETNQPRQLIENLRTEFSPKHNLKAPQPAEVDPPVDKPLAEAADRRKNERADNASGKFQRRLLKTTVAAALAIVVGWQPIQTILTPTSIEAFVNTSVFTLRAPLSGRINLSSSDVEIGEFVTPADAIMNVSSISVDRSKASNLESRLNELKIADTAASKNTDALVAEKSLLTRQKNAFISGRIAELEQKLDIHDANIKEAAARLEFVEWQNGRAVKDYKAGKLGVTKYRESIVTLVAAQSNLDRSRSEFKATEIELDALKVGHFIGDNYNDIPFSAQRESEVRKQITALNTATEQNRINRQLLETELATEQVQVAALESASLTVPNKMSVWEVLAADGELVEAGQPLARFLDCSKTIVSAAVGESVYSKLRVGQEAKFRFLGEKSDHVGKIIRLSGLGNAPGNLAISPSELLKAPFRAAIEIPNLTQAANCDIGRSGRVSFAQ